MAIGRRDDVTIRYGADDTRFQKVTKRVKSAGADVAGFFGKVGSSIGAVFGRSLPGAIAATATAFTAMSKSALQSADSLAKTSDKIGVNIEDLQRLRYAASTAGVEQRVLDTALQRFSRRVGEAANGTGVLLKEFEALGIQVRDAQGNIRSNTDLLFEYAEAVRNAGSAQEQLRLNVAAFDTEGGVMVNLTRQGAQGMRELLGVADELGNVLSEKTVREAEALNQAWDDMTTRWGSYWKKTILDMTLAVDKLAGNFRTAATAVERLGEIEEELLEIEKNRVETTSRLYDIQTRRIQQLQRERQELRGTAEELKKVEQAEKGVADAARKAAAAADAAQTKAAGSKAAKGPENTYHEQNLADYRAYKSGEITRSEWLERERNRNPYANPGSPYAGEFGFKDGQPPGYTSVMPSRPATTVLHTPEVSKAFADEVQKAVTAALEGKTYNVKVLPEIVGYSGDAIEQAATQEGETQ